MLRVRMSSCFRDFTRVEEILLAPVVEALAPIVNISVESQVFLRSLSEAR